jgi:hypothetical protein
MDAHTFAVIRNERNALRLVLLVPVAREQEQRTAIVAACADKNGSKKRARKCPKMRGEKAASPLKNKHKNNFDKIGKSVKLHGEIHGKKQTPL